MDPITAALNLATEILRTINNFWDSLTDEQKKSVIQSHITNLEVFQKILEQFIKTIGPNQ
jgi:hypothetical protein